MRRLVIDRFEGGFALCEGEDGAMVQLCRNEMPVNAREGDVLIESDGKITVDAAGTEARRAGLRARMNRLKRR